jgi:hypothetical protein
MRKSKSISRKKAQETQKEKGCFFAASVFAIVEKYFYQY